MKKKVLYITYDGLTDPLGQSQVIPYLNGLAKEGYCITILSVEKAEMLAANYTHIVEEKLDKKIRWNIVQYSNQVPFFSFFYILLKLFVSSYKIFRRDKFEIVHCRSYIPSIIGLFYCKVYGVKFLFDMRGFWADERIEGGIWDLSKGPYKIMYKAFKKLEIKFFRNAAVTISLTDVAKEYIQKKYNNKVVVIPCSCNYSSYYPIAEDEKEIFRKAIGIPKDVFLVNYVGSIGTWYMLDEMLHYFSVLKKEKPNAIFLILTPGDKELVFRQANKFGIEKDSIIVKFVRHNELRNYVGASNVSLFFIRNTFSKTASSPTKLGELLAMGIPVICNSIGDIDAIAMETKGISLIENFDDDSFQNSVIGLDDFLKTYNSNEVRERSRKYFDLTFAIEKYKLCYCQS